MKNVILIMSADISLLEINSKIWLIDGTFNLCEANFVLTVILALINDVYIPILFVLSSRPSQDTYNYMWYFIKRRCSNVDPQVILCDFEQGLQNSLRLHFNKALIKGN